MSTYGTIQTEWPLLSEAIFSQGAAHNSSCCSILPCAKEETSRENELVLREWASEVWRRASCYHQRVCRKWGSKPQSFSFSEQIVHRIQYSTPGKAKANKINSFVIKPRLVRLHFCSTRKIHSLSLSPSLYLFGSHIVF